MRKLKGRASSSWTACTGSAFKRQQGKAAVQRFQSLQHIRKDGPRIHGPRTRSSRMFDAEIIRNQLRRVVVRGS